MSLRSDHPLVVVWQASMLVMGLFIVALVGAWIAQPNWPTGSECAALCASAGQRVHSFRPHDNARGLCTCAPVRRCP